MPNYRFSGHESFPCRYAWLPKAFRAITQTESIFADEEAAIVRLGVGKNMVRAIRFWMQVSRIAEPSSGGYAVTEFGKSLLHPEGLDPYLEDRRTLWLLHWNLATHVDEPLFAWDYLLNRWSNPEFSRTEVLRAFTQEAGRLNRKLSHVTLEQHFDVFLHTYVPTQGRKTETQEDNLDCPLVELELIRSVGERETANRGRREAIFAFRQEGKDEITSGLFVYCLDDFWRKRRSNEKTLTFRDVALAHGSPGQIFKLPEWDIRQRLESLHADSAGWYEYQETAMLQRITCTKKEKPPTGDLLAAVYVREEMHA